MTGHFGLLTDILSRLWLLVRFDRNGLITLSTQRYSPDRLYPYAQIFFNKLCPNESAQISILRGRIASLVRQLRLPIEVCIFVFPYMKIRKRIAASYGIYRNYILIVGSCC